MKKTLPIALIFVVVFSAFTMFVIHSGKVSANNNHSRTIIISNLHNPETLDDYQVFVNVTYDSDMQPDFDDLRFTWYNETSGQEVSIDYWLDKYVESEYALVWIEVPSIRALGQEVLYMYYGDADALSESNGEETFVFFDGFSTDTTANYEVWNNPDGEIGWNPDGYLFVNASIRQALGRCSNVHVRHKTALINATEEKYWLETRAKAFGTGFLDYFGVSYAYKIGTSPNVNHVLFHYVYTDIWGENSTNIQSHWASGWEFREAEHSVVPSGKCEWYRIGLGTSRNGTVVGRVYDDNYDELVTIVNQTIHQNNEWWVDLLASRGHTDTWATLYAHFDDVRVRKFTDPEPAYWIGPEDPLPATVDIDPDTLNSKSNGQWITAYITLPEGHNVENIILETVEVDGIPAAWSEIQNGVYMVKFDRVAIQTSLTNESDYESESKFYALTLTVTGELADGTLFEGRDTIKVLQKQ